MAENVKIGFDQLILHWLKKQVKIVVHYYLYVSGLEQALRESENSERHTQHVCIQDKAG